MNKNIIISIAVIVVVSLSLLLGYFWGRSSVELPNPEVKEIVRWEKEPYAIHDTIKIPKPYRVDVPVDRPIFISTDTAALFAVWCDYYLKREYKLDFSSDTLGTFVADVSIQENKLLSATSTIQPIRKVTERTETVYKVPKMQPWLMLGTSVDLRTNKIQIGLDIKNKFVIGASGLRWDEKYSYTLDFGIKF